MIERGELLGELKSVTRDLVDDLRQRADGTEEVGASVRAQYQAARSAGRTERTYEDWREDLLAQVAVGWVLGTVFVRFCEDNGLWPVPLLSGPGSRRDLARDHRTDWLSRNPASGDRDWLLEVFGHYRETPATSGVFGAHNPLWQFGPSDDGARALLEMWWEVDGDTGALRFDFTDGDLDTRFLGDLYQDLSDHAKKEYALLQTPEFVEEFILDRTLEPAIETFGLLEVRMIDPTCGSGHFLLGAFRRLLSKWREREPGTPVRELVQRSLNAVHGVDLNPFAVAIARFRLLVVALKASGIHELRSAPDFHLRLATGDSLIHGQHGGQLLKAKEGRGTLLAHRYSAEDTDEGNEILQSGRYHAVVGNPPYITVKEPALRDAYRGIYDAASGKYSLVVPFTERFFDLTQQGDRNSESGYVGVITANSFMKRTFGKRLIEGFFATIDLTHVIDTSGAYIPGHGTPTVILLGRNRKAGSNVIRSVLGIRGEPGTPRDASNGQVWRSIVEMVDLPGTEGDFVSVEDTPRSAYLKHPWSLQGGAAPVLKEAIVAGRSVLGAAATSIGITSVTGEDDVFVWNRGRWSGAETTKPLVIGEDVRDWAVTADLDAVWPYDDRYRVVSFNDLREDVQRLLWMVKNPISRRRRFGVPMLTRGAMWWEWQELYATKLQIPLSITFAFVATHNHFVLDRGGKVFNRSAPIIKLPKDASEDDHLRLLGLLNSSTACFWMKQVFHNKGSTVDGHGARQTTIAFENFWEHDGTKLKQFPIPRTTPLERPRTLDVLAQELESSLPAHHFREQAPTSQLLAEAEARAASIRARMVALQEELDWECYHLYGLIDRCMALDANQLPELQRGERAFEILLAREVAAGRVESTWFERHRTTPVTELPADWSDAYRQAVEERIALIEEDRKIRLLERPEYKRRWNWQPWEDMVEEALKEWFLDRIESLSVWQEPELQTVARLADHLARDGEAMEAARLYVRQRDVDASALVDALVKGEAVPYLAALRFKASGRRKRQAWEETWDLQRQEDEIDARAALSEEDPRHLPSSEVARAKEAAGVDDIPVPPRYTAGDFARSSWWRLRGKLDVPEERFISYPSTRIGADDSPVMGWAGWDHLQRARALAGHYQRRKDEGAGEDEVIPLLAGLQELVPWLLQWHNEPDPEFGQRMGEFFQTFVESEARAVNRTGHDLRTWTP